MWKSCKVSEKDVTFKERLKDKGIKGFVISIDETLSGTVYYMAGKLARLYGNPKNLSVEELREKILAHDIPSGSLKKSEIGGCKPSNRKKWRKSIRS